jgi:hypothetical protein
LEDINIINNMVATSPLIAVTEVIDITPGIVLLALETDTIAVIDINY